MSEANGLLGKPDFYMASTEIDSLKHARKCWRIRPLASETREDLLLITVDPPVLHRNHDWARLIIASRHRGYSVHAIKEWPIYVHVAVTSRDACDNAGRVRNDELDAFGWAELYQTESEARAAAAEIPDRR